MAQAPAPAGHFPQSHVMKGYGRFVSMVVGRLVNPIPDLELRRAGFEWRPEARRRVFAQRNLDMPGSLQFVTCDGKALNPLRQWKTRVSSELCGLPMPRGTHMRGNRELQPAVDLANIAPAQALGERWAELTPRQRQELALNQLASMQQRIRELSRPVELRPPDRSTAALARLDRAPAVSLTTPECTICSDAFACTVFTGCGHRCACFECAKKLGDKCPICREHSVPIAIFDA